MKRFLQTILLLLIAQYAAAITVEIQTMVNVVPDSYEFYLYLPDSYSREGEPKPLVMHLHGASCCGGPLSRSRRYGTLDAVTRGMNLDAVIVNPHNRGGSWSPKKLIAIVDYIIDHYNVDPNRVYVLGMSLGGYGTMDFANAYPDRIAAAMPFCGGSTAKTYEGLGQVPLWIVHGTADRDVPVSRSREVVEWLRKRHQDSLLIYSELPGINHGAPARLFYQKETYNWLFQHRLSEHRTVDRTSHTITAATCRKPYEFWKHATLVERKGKLEPKMERKPVGEEEDSITDSNKKNDKKHTPKKVKEKVEAPEIGQPDSPVDPASDTQPDQHEVKAIPEVEEQRIFTYHKVRAGDTLSSIAEHYHTDIEALCLLNDITEDTPLTEGDTLRIN